MYIFSLFSTACSTKKSKDEGVLVGGGGPGTRGLRCFRGRLCTCLESFGSEVVCVSVAEAAAPADGGGPAAAYFTLFPREIHR